MRTDARPDDVQNRRVGVVVIHGIGEAEPGYCVNALTASLQDTVPGYAIAPMSSNVQLPDLEPRATFPATIRNGAHEDGTQFTTVDMHWADLARPATGSLNASLGILRVTFESHHLVHAFLNHRTGLAMWLLRTVLWLSGWLLRGPISAIMITATAAYAVILFAPDAPQTLAQDFRWRFMMSQLVLLSFSTWFLVRNIRRSDMPFVDTALWVFISSGSLLVLDFAGLLPGLLDFIPSLSISVAPSADLLESAYYTNGLFQLFTWLLRIWFLLTLICIVVLVVASFVLPRDARRIATSSICLSVLQFMLWTIVIAAAVNPIVQRAELNHELQSIKPILERAVQLGEIRSENLVLTMVNGPELSADWIDRVKLLCAGAAIVLLLLLLIVLFVLQVRRWRLRFRSGRHGHQKRPGPVFANTSLAALPVFGIIAIIMVFYFTPVLDQNDFFAASINWIFWAAVLVAAAVPRYFDRHLSLAVRLARDVMDHHYNRALESGLFLLPSRTNYKFPRRARIQRRLTTLLNSIMRDERFDEIIFVAHSQGSVIALDYIRQASTNYPEIGRARFSLLTLGSPIGTVYQHYFREYESDAPATPEARQRATSWINLYRIDDGIGGHINWPALIAIENQEMPPGGHMNYWTERDVALALDTLIRTNSNRLSMKGPNLSSTPIVGSSHVENAQT